jgi:hypothetical protein
MVRASKDKRLFSLTLCYDQAFTCITTWSNSSTSEIRQTDTQCFPPGRSGAPDINWAWGATYSPGLSCPASYVSACSVSGPHLASWQMISMASSETAVGCCPRYRTDVLLFDSDGSSGLMCYKRIYMHRLFRDAIQPSHVRHFNLELLDLQLVHDVQRISN